MINRIIDGISISLNAEFGENYKVYTESIEQGLKEPCFSILCVNPTNELFLGKRYFRKNLFCIQYFPSTGEKYAECMDVLERMYDCLEIIKVGEDHQKKNENNIYTNLYTLHLPSKIKYADVVNELSEFPNIHMVRTRNT